MHSLKPSTPINPTNWLLPNLLPQAELVLLDAPSGTGKTLLLAHITAQLSHQSTKPILVLTSPNQRDLFIEHLEKHQPDYTHLQGLDLPGNTSENTPITEHLYDFLKTTLTQHNPQLLLIDSLEELLSPLSPPGRGARGEGDPTHGEAHQTAPLSPPGRGARGEGISSYGEAQPIDLHQLWHNLRQLAHDHNCTILITRTHGHHESRQYTPFTRYGSDITRYALTILYHPTDTSIRVITRAKNLRGPIGEQFHLFFTPKGNTGLLQADFHLHVRPTRTPTTWIPSPRNLIEDQEIIDLTEILMLGKPTQADDLLKELTKCYPLPAVRRTLAQTRMPITFHNKRYYYLPTPQMKERAPHLKAEMLRHPSPSRGEGMGVRGSLVAKPNLSAKPPENTARTHPTANTHQPAPITKPSSQKQGRQAG